MTKKFTVIVCCWFDSVNGNTYHSVRCIRHSDGAVIGSGRKLKCGYDNQFRGTAQKLMQEAGWIILPKDTPGYSYDQDNGYPIIWTVSDGLKRDAVENGDV